MNHLCFVRAISSRVRSRAIRLRLQNDLAAVWSGIRPTVLLDACALSATEQSAIVSACGCDAAPMALLRCPVSGTVWVCRCDALLRLLQRDDDFFKQMRLVDADTLEATSVLECDWFEAMRAFLIDALESARHGDVIELRDWQVYPPTLTGVLLGYPVVFARRRDAWDRPLELGGDVPLTLVQVRVESAALVHAPSPGELLISGRQPASRGELVWSFSAPTAIALDDAALQAHFGALLFSSSDAAPTADQLHIVQQRVPSDTAISL